MWRVAYAMCEIVAEADNFIDKCTNIGVDLCEEGSRSNVQGTLSDGM